MRARFDVHKALELILYVASHVREPDVHRVSKILYFADKAHLARYGRLMAGDRYVAMKHGPVPSGAYDVMKYARDGATRFFSLPEADDSLAVEGERNVVALRDANHNALSESECECLEEAIERYGRLSFNQLTDESHDGAWHAADENEIISADAIADSLPNSEALRDYLRDPYPDD